MMHDIFQGRFRLFNNAGSGLGIVMVCDDCGLTHFPETHIHCLGTETGLRLYYSGEIFPLLAQ